MQDACTLQLPVFAGPLLAIVFVLVLRRKLLGPSPKFLIVAAGIGALIALPWWLLDYRSALGYLNCAAHYSVSWPGRPGIRTTAAYVARFLQEGPGVPLALLGFAILAVGGARLWRARETKTLTQQLLAAVCVMLAAVPTFVSPLFTDNDAIYHVSQALIPLAMGLAILAVNDGWTSSPVRFAALRAVVVAQLALTLAPVVMRARFEGVRTPWTALGAWEQWDWNELRLVLRPKGLTAPSIGYLGAMSVLNPPQIAYPWFRSGEPAPRVTWLWRAESGPADVAALVASASRYDVMLTSPELATQNWGGDNVHNQHNADFATRLASAPEFQPPLRFRMGRFRPTDVWVFVRK